MRQLRSMRFLDCSVVFISGVCAALKASRLMGPPVQNLLLIRPGHAILSIPSWGEIIKLFQH